MQILIANAVCNIIPQKLYTISLFYQCNQFQPGTPSPDWQSGKQVSIEAKLSCLIVLSMW